MPRCTLRCDLHLKCLRCLNYRQSSCEHHNGLTHKGRKSRAEQRTRCRHVRSHRRTDRFPVLAHRLALYVATQACCLTVLDARHGEPLGIGKDAWLRPKHVDAALALVLLDAAGAPVQALPGPCALPWAGNAIAPKQPAAKADHQLEQQGEQCEIPTVLWYMELCRVPAALSHQDIVMMYFVTRQQDETPRPPHSQLHGNMLRTPSVKSMRSSHRSHRQLSGQPLPSMGGSWTQATLEAAPTRMRPCNHGL